MSDRGSHPTRQGGWVECWIHLRIPPICCSTSPSKKGGPTGVGSLARPGPSAQIYYWICHSPSPHLVGAVSGLRRGVNRRGSRARASHSCRAGRLVLQKTRQGTFSAVLARRSLSQFLNSTIAAAEPPQRHLTNKHGRAPVKLFTKQVQANLPTVAVVMVWGQLSLLASREPFPCSPLGPPSVLSLERLLPHLRLAEGGPSPVRTPQFHVLTPACGSHFPQNDH